MKHLRSYQVFIYNGRRKMWIWKIGWLRGNDEKALSETWEGRGLKRFENWEMEGNENQFKIENKIGNEIEK